MAKSVYCCTMYGFPIVPSFAGKELPLRWIHYGFVILADIFSAGHKKSRRTAGGVAYPVVRSGSDKVYQHITDVLGSAELSVLSRRGKLAQHVLV